MSRPELTGHASLFYNAKEARKYDSSSRMMGIQREITNRAVELLRLDPQQSYYILDIGCGSGLSGQVLEEHGHVWVGCDVSKDMLLMAKERMDADDNNNNNASMNDDSDDDSNSKGNSDKDEVDSIIPRVTTGDLLHHDMGCGLPFQPATFDACISISALQWLCYSNNKAQNPRQRLLRFFSSLYTVLKRGGRAVLQFYPETAEQAVLVSETATRVGFAGGIVVDYPNSAKAKKHYLVLSFDKSARQKERVAEAAGLSTSIQPSTTTVTVSGTHNDNGKNKKKQIVRKKKGGVKTKEWILHKKQSQRKNGKSVRPDTKYTARRRPTKF